MKLYLHIGQQKTGSTTIQKFFEVNRKKLLKNGYIYPQSLGYDKQFDIYKRIDELMDSNSNLHKSFFKELKKSNCQKLIISEENVFTLRDELLDKVTYFLNKYFEDVTLICYLRRQYDQAASLYQEVVKGKVHLKYNKWIQKKLKQGYYDYNYVLKRWEDRMPSAKVIARPFSNLIDGDIRKDILEAIHFSQNSDLNFDEKYNYKNTGIDTLSIEILRVSNGYIKKGKVDDIEKFRKKIRDFVFARKFDKKLQLHHNQKMELWKSFYESNKILVEKYHIKNGEYFLNEPAVKEGWTNDDHSPKEVLEILGQLYDLNQ